jgi:hypothetical protein
MPQGRPSPLMSSLMRPMQVHPMQQPSGGDQTGGTGGGGGGMPKRKPKQPQQPQTNQYVDPSTGQPYPIGPTQSGDPMGPTTPAPAAAAPASSDDASGDYSGDDWVGGPTARGGRTRRFR